MSLDQLNVIILGLNLLILTWYTIETMKLRKTTQYDSKDRTEPLLVLDFNASRYSQGIIDDDVDISDVEISLVNIGGGTALNVQFDKIKNLYAEEANREVAFRLPQTSTIFAGEKTRLAVTEFTDGRRLRGGHPHPLLIPNMIVDDNTEHSIWYDTDAENTHWKDHSYDVYMRYQDKLLNNYATHVHISKLGAEIVSHKKIRRGNKQS